MELPPAGRLPIPWLVIAVLMALPVAGCGADQERRDADLVHCLALRNRSELVEAADSLGLVTAEGDHVRLGDRSLTIEQWRTEHPRDFERACAALTRASQSTGGAPDGGPDNAWLASILSLFSALLAAIGTAAAAAYLETRGRRYATAERLRTVAGEFERATGEYVGSWTGGRGPKLISRTMLDRRNALVDELTSIARQHPAWVAVPAMARTLRQAPLRDDLDDLVYATATRATTLDAVAATRAALTKRLTALVRAVERPMFHLPTLVWVPRRDRSRVQTGDTG